MRPPPRASVWPHAEFFYAYPGDGTLRFAAANSGLGPARIETFEILANGAPVQSWGAAAGR